MLSVPTNMISEFWDLFIHFLDCLVFNVRWKWRAKIDYNAQLLASLTHTMIHIKLGIWFSNMVHAFLSTGHWGYVNIYLMADYKFVPYL